MSDPRHFLRIDLFARSYGLPPRVVRRARARILGGQKPRGVVVAPGGTVYVRRDADPELVFAFGQPTPTT